MELLQAHHLSLDALPALLGEVYDAGSMIVGEGERVSSSDSERSDSDPEIIDVDGPPLRPSKRVQEPVAPVEKRLKASTSPPLLPFVTDKLKVISVGLAYFKGHIRVFQRHHLGISLWFYILSQVVTQSTLVVSEHNKKHLVAAAEEATVEFGRPYAPGPIQIS